jgi:signal transduction histidine kinase
MGLAEALRSLWDTMGVAQKFKTELDLVPMAAELPLEKRVLLYRVAQEALANVVRHARATRLRLWLGPGAGGRQQLIVEDNGSGFDVTAAVGEKTASAGIGLRAMHDQLRWAGGGLMIESGPGGTRLTAWVPGAAA